MSPSHRPSDQTSCLREKKKCLQRNTQKGDFQAAETDVIHGRGYWGDAYAPTTGCRFELDWFYVICMLLFSNLLQVCLKANISERLWTGCCLCLCVFVEMIDYRWWGRGSRCSAEPRSSPHARRSSVPPSACHPADKHLNSRWFLLERVSDGKWRLTFFQSVMSLSFRNRKIPFPWDLATFKINHKSGLVPFNSRTSSSL